MRDQKWCALGAVISNRVQHASVAILVRREGPEGLSNLSRPRHRALMAKSLDQLVDEVREGLAVQLRARGATLAVQVRKAGRGLPRAVRKDADYLVRAVALSENPKLARQIDMRRAQAAHRHILLHLETIDLTAQRRNAALNMIASIAFALLATVVLVITVIWWRGLY